jgi:predicted HicB family RNase H-like nuclease
VEVRLAGDESELIYVDGQSMQAAEPADEALDARITLRLPESLKSRLEAAAAANGVSLNTWLVQALGRAPEPRPTAGGSRHRLTGYGRS